MPDLHPANSTWENTLIMGGDPVLPFLTRQHLLSRTIDALHIDSADYSDPTQFAAAAFDALRTPALFGPSRTVDMSIEKLDAAQWKKLTAAVEDGQANPFLILTPSTPPASALNALRSAGVKIVDLPSVQPRGMHTWLRTLCRALQADLSGPALALLVQRCADDPVSAVAPIRIAALSGRRFEPADVDALTSAISTTAAAWSCVEAALSSRTADAFTLLQRSDPIPVLTVCANNVLDAGLALAAQAQGIDPSTLGLSGPKLRQARTLGSASTLSSLRLLLEQILDLDAAAKAEQSNELRMEPRDAALIALSLLADQVNPTCHPPLVVPVEESG